MRYESQSDRDNRSWASPDNERRLGPVIAHTTTVPSASAKTQARPTSREMTFAASANSLFGVRKFLGGGTRIGVLEPFFRSGVLGMLVPTCFTCDY